MVADPIKNIVTNPAHLWGSRAGISGWPIANLPARRGPGRQSLDGGCCRAREVSGEAYEKTGKNSCTPPAVVPTPTRERADCRARELSGEARTGKTRNPQPSPAVVPTPNLQVVIVGHGNCHSNGSCRDVSGNSRSSRPCSTLDTFSPRWAQAAVIRR